MLLLNTKAYVNTPMTFLSEGRILIGNEGESPKGSTAENFYAKLAAE
jgi:hypothetical protein